MQPSSHSCTELSKMQFFPVSIVDKYLPILQVDLDLKEIFPRKSVTTVYRMKKASKKSFYPNLLIAQLV